MRIRIRSPLGDRLGGAVDGAFIFIMLVCVVETANAGNAWAALFFTVVLAIGVFVLITEVKP